MAEHFFYHMCYLFYQLLYSKINSIRNVIIVLILNIIFHFLPFSFSASSNIIYLFAGFLIVLKIFTIKVYT